MGRHPSSKQKVGGSIFGLLRQRCVLLLMRALSSSWSLGRAGLRLLIYCVSKLFPFACGQQIKWQHFETSGDRRFIHGVSCWGHCGFHAHCLQLFLEPLGVVALRQCLQAPSRNTSSDVLTKKIWDKQVMKSTQGFHGGVQTLNVVSVGIAWEDIKIRSRT